MARVTFALAVFLHFACLYAFVLHLGIAYGTINWLAFSAIGFILGRYFPLWPQ